MYSMTAFARRERHTEWGNLVWELRSVNQRFLDVTLRLPDELRDLEGAARQQAGARLSRGKLECSLRLQRPADTGSFSVNAALAHELVQACGTIQALMNGPAAPVAALDVLRWPGVMQTRELRVEALAGEALGLLDEALIALLAEWGREGAALHDILAQRCAAMEAQVAQVRSRLPEIRRRLRTRLEERLAQTGVDLDSGRLEQEMVYWLQKIDVDEELDRTAAHLAEIHQLLDAEVPVGRRLDFLLQELNREANTLGSKSADIETTRSSVEMKVLIEQMREQVQNVE